MHGEFRSGQTVCPRTQAHRRQAVAAGRCGDAAAGLSGAMRLIESLHAAQAAFGYLDETAMRYVAKSLRVPLSKVFGVATFYHHFTLKPQGKHAASCAWGPPATSRARAKILEEIEGRVQDQGRADDGGQRTVAAVGAVHRGVRPGARGGARRGRDGQGDTRSKWSRRSKGSSHRDTGRTSPK